MSESLRRCRTITSIVKLVFRSDRPLGPETPQIEGQLAVMLNRQKINSSSPNEVEYDVVVDGKLPEFVAVMNYASKAIDYNLRLSRSDAMGQKGTTRLREAR